MYSLEFLQQPVMFIGMPELLIILVIVVVIFGASRLPQLGKGLGEGISNFRDGLSKGKTEKPEDKKLDA